MHPHALSPKETEIVVAKVWGEVLKLHDYKILPTDNFFLLGGDSLKMTQIMQRLIERLKIELTLSELFGLSSVRQMAAYCCAALSLRPAAGLASQAESQGCENDEYFASAAQCGLWYVEQLHAGHRALYNTSVQLEFIGELDVLCLGQALDALVLRHEALRSSFHFEHRSTQLKVRTEQAYSLDVEIHETESLFVKVKVQEFIKQEFDLSQGQLMRTRLLRIKQAENKPSRHLLILCIHHIVTDGWSGGIILSELADYYRQFLNHTKASFITSTNDQKLTARYRDYCQWQQQQLDNNAFSTELDYWRGALHKLSSSALLSINRNVVRHTYHCACLNFNIRDGQFLALKELANSVSSSLFVVMQAAFKIALSLNSDSKELVLGVPVANRPLPAWEKLVGYFVNLLVLRDKLDADDSLGSFLAKVQVTTLAALEHQNIPFQTLVNFLHAEDSLVEVLFAYQNLPFAEPEFEGLKLVCRKPDNRYCHYELSLEINEKTDGLACRLEYASELFDEQQIKTLIQDYQHVLFNMIKDPKQKIAKLKQR